MRAAALTAAVAASLLGCGTSSGECRDQPGDVLGLAHGAVLIAASDVEFPVDRAGLLPEVEEAIAVAARVWDVPVTVLAGWEIAVDGGWFSCRTPEGGYWTWGCSYPTCGQMRIAPDQHGCRAGVLIHEVGHVIGIHDHSDPRYAVAAAEIETFCGRPL